MQAHGEGERLIQNPQTPKLRNPKPEIPGVQAHGEGEQFDSTRFPNVRLNIVVAPR